MAFKEIILKKIIQFLYTEFKAIKNNDLMDEYSEDIPLKKTNIIKPKKEIIKDLQLMIALFPSASFTYTNRKEKYVNGIIAASILSQIFGITANNFCSFQKEMIDGGINIDIGEKSLNKINKYYYIFKDAWNHKVTQEYDGLVETFLLNPLKGKINELLKEVVISVPQISQKRPNPFRVNFRLSFQKHKKPKLPF